MYSRYYFYFIFGICIIPLVFVVMSARNLGIIDLSQPSIPASASAGAPVGGDNIDFTPSYKTLTETGKSHFSSAYYRSIELLLLPSVSSFSGVCDALAEFVDNSLQALTHVRIISPEETSSSASSHLGSGTASAMSREICIQLILESDESFIIIADNGAGMNTNQMRQYATFALDQNSRSGPRDEFISRFGVGAKQAGFYLGDQMSILSKKVDEDVLLLELGVDMFEERVRRGEQVIPRTGIGVFFNGSSYM